MEQVLIKITEYLWNQSGQVALLFFLVAGLSWIFRSASAHWRYLLWSVILIKCLFPPLWIVPLALFPALESPPAKHVSPPVAENASLHLAKNGVPRSSPLAPVQQTAPGLELHKGMEKSRAFGVKAWFGLSWAAGLGLFMLVYLIRAWRINLTQN